MCYELCITRKFSIGTNAKPSSQFIKSYAIEIIGEITFVINSKSFLFSHQIICNFKCGYKEFTQF